MHWGEALRGQSCQKVAVLSLLSPAAMQVRRGGSAYVGACLCLCAPARHHVLRLPPNPPIQPPSIQPPAHAHGPCVRSSSTLGCPSSTLRPSLRACASARGNPPGAYDVRDHGRCRHQRRAGAAGALYLCRCLSHTQGTHARTRCRHQRPAHLNRTPKNYAMPCTPARRRSLCRGHRAFGCCGHGAVEGGARG
jgi:hypothetical protein